MKTKRRSTLDTSQTWISGDESPSPPASPVIKLTKSSGHSSWFGNVALPPPPPLFGRTVTSHSRPVTRREINGLKRLKLRRTLNKLDDSLDSAASELEMRRMAREAMRSQQKVEMANLQEKYEWALRNYEKRIKKNPLRRSSLHVYISTIKSVTGPRTTYIENIEAQVCRSVHMICAMEKALEQTKGKADQMIDWLKKQQKVQINDKSEVELNLLNQIIDVSAINSKIDKDCQTQLTEQMKQIEELELLLLKNSVPLKDNPESTATLSRPRRSRGNTISYSTSIAEKSRNTVSKSSTASLISCSDDETYDFDDPIYGSAPPTSLARRSTTGMYGIMDSIFNFTGNNNNQMSLGFSFSSDPIDELDGSCYDGVNDSTVLTEGDLLV